MAPHKSMPSKIMNKIIKFKIYHNNNAKLPIFAKIFFIQRLGKNIGQLIIRVYEIKNDMSILHMLPNKMMSNVNVFSSKMIIGF